jgi:uncharacterized membrane protein
MTAIYRWFLFFHLVAALWLAAGIFSSSVVRAYGRRAKSITERVTAARLLWRLHVVYTLPGVLAAGGLGFYLLGIGGFRMSELWVLSSAFLYLLMFLSTSFVVTPALARQRKAANLAVAADAPPEASAALNEEMPGIVSDINALLMLVLVSLMAIKP